jgi:hypothetical protein
VKVTASEGLLEGLCGFLVALLEADEVVFESGRCGEVVGVENLVLAELSIFDNPIGTRLSPMSPVRSVTHVSGPDLHSVRPTAWLAISDSNFDVQKEFSSL